MRSRFQGGSRLDWPDWAKGIGIIFVVIGHVWRGLHQAGVLTDAQLFRTVDTLIYNFHMPLFFFVAGLFFSHQFLRSGLSLMLWSRVVGLLWPLAVWTWIFFALKAAIGHLANNPVPWNAFPVLPLPPREEFWFLWALFLAQAALALVWRWGGSVRGQILLLFVSLLLYWLRPGVSDLGIWLVGSYNLAPMLLVGCLYASIAPRPSAWEQPLFWLVVFMGAEAASVLLPFHGLWKQLLLGMTAVIGLARMLDCIGSSWQGRFADVMAWLGRASLTIYVGHVFFAAMVRIVMLKLGIHALGTHILVGVGAGLIGPILMALGLRRLNLSRALGLRFP